MPDSHKTLSRDLLKLIAVVCMVLDHTALLFLKENLILYQVLRFLGRFTAPIMSYFLAEGFYYTHSCFKYGLRLFLFSLISFLPFNWFLRGAVSFHDFQFYRLSVLSTFFLAFITLYAWDNCKLATVLKVCILAGSLTLSLISDWPTAGVLWPLAFYVFRNKPVYKWSLYYMICGYMLVLLIQEPYDLYNLGMLAAPLPLLFYNNTKLCFSKKAWTKYAFYVFYPMHLVLLTVIKMSVS